MNVPSLLATVALTAAVAPAYGQRDDLARLESDAVAHLRAYLQVNTINPPGNESRAVAFFAQIFDAEGIAYESAESAPGRGNIWARLKGGSKPALVLLHHTDVVPADSSHWDVPPLSGALKDGHLYGRGALDTKALGVFQLEAFLALHRAKRPLDRDVIFMATADEEAGGFYGAGWLVEHRPALFRNVGFVLNEGGGGSLTAGRQEVGVEVTQKVPLWLRMVATGRPGHGSTPRPASAVTRLVRALDAIREYEFPARIIPAVDAYFKGIAPTAGDEWRAPFSDMATAVTNPEFLTTLQLHNPYLHAITRTTCTITRLEGSNKINVVPPEAAAELDCRLLPDQDPDDIVATLHTIIGDPAIRIERIMAFTPAVSSTDTDLYRAIVDVSRKYFPQAAILPTVQSGFTDSHFVRDLGIVAYGYAPIMVPIEDDAGVHGNNERISVENVRRGARMMLEIVERVAGAR